MAKAYTWNPTFYNDPTYNQTTWADPFLYRVTCTGVSTLLTADAASGQKIVDMVSTTGLVVNAEIKISDTAASETNYIATVNSGTRLTTKNNLANTYTTARTGTVQNKIFSANIRNTVNNDLFTDTFVPQDTLYFGMTIGWGVRLWTRWAGLWFDASGAGGLNTATTFTGVWEYWNGTAWATLTVTDATTNFTTITGGAVGVTWTPPSDEDYFLAYCNTAGAPTTWSAMGTGGRAFGVRYRILTVTSATEGGKLSTYVKWGSYAINVTGDTAGTDDVTMNDIYQWSLTAGPGATDLGVIIPLDTSKTTGHRAYRIKCHITIGGTGYDSMAAKAGYFTDKNFDLIFDNYFIFFGDHTNSICTIGNEQTANTIGSQGCNFRYNIKTQSARLDYTWLGTVYLYNMNFIVNVADATITDGLSNYQAFISDTAKASEYLNLSFQGFGSIQLTSSTSGYKKHIYFLNVATPGLAGGGTIDDVYAYSCRVAYYPDFNTTAATQVDQIVNNLNSSGNIVFLLQCYYWSKNCYLVNPNIPVIVDNTTNCIRWSSGPTLQSSGTYRLQWTVNVHAQDEFGTSIQNATVTMQPDPTAPITALEYSNNFSVATDASGNITQQTVTSNLYSALTALLTVACNAGDTSLTVDSTTNFPASDVSASIGDYGTTDYFSYTGKTATTITGIPASGGYAVGAYPIGTKVFAPNVSYSSNRAYTPMMITVSKAGYKTAVLRKIVATSANFGLKGMKFIVTLPHETVNMASEVITAT